jgi:hypothetical protein
MYCHLERKGKVNFQMSHGGKIWEKIIILKVKELTSDLACLCIMRFEV